ncbi:MAG: UxaA family hydrolase [Firmicutes bacterium]|nr:UxaA family hydrolase [Bacillota bacterium]
MLEKSRAVRIDPADNVAVMLDSVKEGHKIEVIDNGKIIGEIEACNTIPVGHKVALLVIPKDGVIYKYGEAIGIAENLIEMGRHVHIHNVRACHESLEVGK